MRLLITGASGQLGGYLLRECARRGLTPVAWTGSQRGHFLGFPYCPVDLTDPAQVAAGFRLARPTAVLHAGVFGTVAGCHREPERARRVNVAGTRTLAELAGQARARLLFVSTDLVFDGERGGYRETDRPAPLSVYGRTKAEAEQLVLGVPGAAVVRVSLLFGPTLNGRPTFFDEQAAALGAGRPVTLFADEWRAPLALATAARALLGIVESDYAGTLHLGGPERMSRLEMGLRLAAHRGADTRLVVPVSRQDHPTPEPRPRDVSLDSSRWRSLFPGECWPSFEEALAQTEVG